MVRTINQNRQTSTRLQRLSETSRQRTGTTRIQRDLINRQRILQQQQDRITQQENEKIQKEFDEVINSLGSSSNINEYKQKLNQVPSYLKPALSNVINQLESQQNQSIQQVVNKINEEQGVLNRKTALLEKRKNSGDDSQKIDSLKIEINARKRELNSLKSGLNELQRGELISPESIIESSRKGAAEYELRKQKKSKVKFQLARDLGSQSQASAILRAGKISDEQIFKLSDKSLELLDIKKPNPFAYIVDGEVKSVDPITAKRLGLKRATYTENISGVSNQSIERDIQKQIEENKKYLKEVRESLPPKDSLIYDKKTYEIKSIQSNVLQKSIPWTEEGLNKYNEEISKLGELAYIQPVSKKPFSSSDIKKNFIELVKNFKKEPFKNISNFIKSLEKEPYYKIIERDSYNSYIRNGGKKTKEEFFKIYTNPKKLNLLTSSEKRIFERTFEDMYKKIVTKDKYGTQKRLNILITASTILTASPVISGTFGGVYKTITELGRVSNNETLTNTTLTAKSIAKEFGKGFAEAYLFTKIFNLGGSTANKLVKNIEKSYSKAGYSGASKFFRGGRNALKQSLNILQAQYISSFGTSSGKIIKDIRNKKYTGATNQASYLLGSLVGLYGFGAVKSALRKVLLLEDPRLIITRGTKGKPFAIEERDITVARLNRAIRILKNKEPKIKYAKASPVREPKSKKILPIEKKVSTGEKTGLKIPSGYATYEVGENIYLVPEIFLRLRKNKSPISYYTEWIKNARKKGLIKTFKEIGLPRLYNPSIYKGSGRYLPRKKGETLNRYYSRAQRISNKTKNVIIVVAPKTVLGLKQPELEIKTIFPNPKGIKANVYRVKVGKDSFGNDVFVETIAPRGVIEKLKFLISQKLKYKKEAFQFLTNKEKKIAEKLIPRIIENYNFIYKSNLKGSKKIKDHMLKVEKNFRRILKEYKIKATEKEIKAVSRLHDILKLRGINIKDEPIIKKALLSGGLNEIPLVRKLNKKELIRVANAIGYHQDVNPGSIKALRLNDFTKAFINADRLDITRYGIKVNKKLLFDLSKNRKLIEKYKKLLSNKNINKIKLFERKYPKIKKLYNKKRIEDSIILGNKKRFKNLSTKAKKQILKQEKDYQDYLEASRKYKGNNRRNKTKLRKPITRKPTKRVGRKPITRKPTLRKPTKRVGRKPITRKPTLRKPTKRVVRKPTLRKPTKRITNKIKPTKRVVRKPITRKPTKRVVRKPIPPTIPKSFKRKVLSREQPVYYIKVKKQGRIVNLTPRPLTLNDARDYLAYQLDNNLTRSAWFEPIGKAKVVVGLPNKMKGYFNKVRNKLRPFRIRLGKKKEIRNGYIEKNKNILDKRTEVRQLARARAKARLIKRKPVKRIIKKRKVNKATKTTKRIIKRAKKKRRK